MPTEPRWLVHVTQLLAEHDPLGLIRMGAPRDEYSLEAKTIVARMGEARSALELRDVFHEEFVRWFDAGTAGSVEHYTAVADQLWADLQGRVD